ncbi:MAG: helix-hairpin-helix domain-containing protein [Candidatus Symbiothrix sp.]|jgi:DNA uptake protein ComE-like DNA-binding protein|nr:helix-hairpin-helix domain-containing protein [Candidatus Symbiothrix sp.]
MSWKDFFYFSRRERQGILLLVVLISGIFLGKFIFSPSKTDAPKEWEEMGKALPSDKAFAEDPEQPYVPLYHSAPREERKTYYHPPQQQEKRTYYVQEKDTTLRPKPANYPKAEKFAEGTVIELNLADSLDLTKIPGVGPAFAKRIISYKNLLGGYHRIEQLQEVYGMYEELYVKITPYLKIDSNEITRIQVNTASLDKMKSHPYINFYQAKAILEMRKKKGKLPGIEELKLLEEFSDEDWVRITPYLEFN